MRAVCLQMQRTRLFEKHLFAHSHLMKALLQVFIDIEFTGHAMQFEQKFSESKDGCNLDCTRVVYHLCI